MFFFYFNSEISEMRRPISAKFCTVIRPRFGGTVLLKFRRAKNIQNTA